MVWEAYSVGDIVASSEGPTWLSIIIDSLFTLLEHHLLQDISVTVLNLNSHLEMFISHPQLS